MRAKDKTYEWESERWETKCESSGRYIPHIHWVTRQNKLEIPIDKDEVNKRDREYDGGVYDPDTMVSPPTPKSTRKAEALARVPPTISSSREGDVVMKEVALPRYRWANYILETKTKVRSTVAKVPDPRANPNINGKTEFSTGCRRSVVVLLWINKTRVKDKTYMSGLL